MINKKVIGAIIVHDDKRLELLSRISADDFTSETAKSVFEKIKAEYLRFPKAEAAAVINSLSDEEKTYALLSAQEAPFASAVEDTVNLFLTTSATQKFNAELSELAILGSATPAEVRALLDNAERKIKRISEADNSKLYLNDFYVPVEHIKTGFIILDEMLNGGFLKKTVGGLGARPSTGKTSWALSVAINNPDLRVLFFSLEMSAGMLYDRMFANLLDIPYAKIHNRKDVTPAEFKKIEELMSVYKNLRIVDDINSIEDIVAEIYRYQPDLVIVDFIQIVTSKTKFIDNRLKIDYISQSFKFTAKACDCHIMILSQLTRAAKDAPTMSALKESGGLEQDSDYVLLLHRPYVNDKNSKENLPNETSLILDKNKFGDNGVIKFDFNGSRQRFTEIGKDDEKITRPVNTMTDDEIIEDLEF